MAVVLWCAVVVAIGVLGWVVAGRRGDRERLDVALLAGPTFGVPGHVDRNDFDGPNVPWLVVLFSAASCASCEDVAAKVRVLESPAVAVAEVDSERDRERFSRYEIDSVPTVVVADADGVVVRHHVGPISATDLWAMLHEARSADET